MSETNESFCLMDNSGDWWASEDIDDDFYLYVYQDYSRVGAAYQARASLSLIERAYGVLDDGETTVTTWCLKDGEGDWWTSLDGETFQWHSTFTGEPRNLYRTLGEIEDVWSGILDDGETGHSLDTYGQDEPLAEWEKELLSIEASLDWPLNGDTLAEVGPPNMESGFVTLDSGERAHFDSGMQRDSEAGKARFDLMVANDVPYADQLLTRTANLMARGAVKYEDRNWEQANSAEELARMKSSAYRHFMQWFCGETDEDHAGAVVFNLIAHDSTEYKMIRNSNTNAP